MVETVCNTWSTKTNLPSLCAVAFYRHSLGATGKGRPHLTWCQMRQGKTFLEGNKNPAASHPEAKTKQNEVGEHR